MLVYVGVQRYRLIIKSVINSWASCNGSIDIGPFSLEFDVRNECLIL